MESKKRPDEKNADEEQAVLKAWPGTVDNGTCQRFKPKGPNNRTLHDVEPKSGGPEILTVKRPVPPKVKGVLWDRRASAGRIGPKAGCFDSI